MVDFTTWDILRNLLLAIRWTVVLSLIAFVGGGLVGLLLLVLRSSGKPMLQRLVAGYVQLFQGTPLLMQLFLAYFGLALLGFETSAWFAASAALTLYSSAFLTEIWHGCVRAIPRGQWEAAQSLAMNFVEQMRHVILPQALPLMLPTFGNNAIELLKATAVVSLISLTDMTFQAQIVRAQTGSTLIPFATILILYFAMALVITAFIRMLERRVTRGLEGVR